MIIRQQQMTSLSEAKRQSFEQRVVDYLNRCFPNECQALTTVGIQSLIRYGIRRAKSHGIDLERDVCKYIALMFTFGRDFDNNRDLPWASNILTDDSIGSSTVKTDRLFAAAKQHAGSPRS
jgi:hypothetical protein